MNGSGYRKSRWALVGAIAFVVGLAAGAAPEASGNVGPALKAAPLWHADTFRAVNGSYSAWCGSLEITSCAPGDQDGGYGRNYDEILEWKGTVADPAQPCTVSVAATINLDTMDGYDYFHISAVTAEDAELDLFSLGGLYDALPVAAQVVYQPGDYVGDDGTEVVIRFRVRSDGGWDGEDCLWPNDGAVQLDDVSIALSNGVGYGHDFEDGTLGQLRVVYRNGGAADVPRSAEFMVNAHPNPFNPTVTISYSASRSGNLAIRVYDVRGQLVRTLFEGQAAPSGDVSWDGTGGGGQPVASGVYFWLADLEGATKSGKLVLVE